MKFCEINMVKRNGIKNFIIQLIIGLAIVLGIVYILKDYVLFFLSYIQQTKILLWMTILIVTAAILLVIFSKSLLKKNHGPMLMSFRTRKGDEKEIPFSFNDLNWIAYIPKQLFELDEYVWLTGPFCPYCSCELKWKGVIKKSWHCERCNKNFKTLKKSAHDERSFVQNMIYADVFRKTKFQNMNKKKL